MPEQELTRTAPQPRSIATNGQLHAGNAANSEEVNEIMNKMPSWIIRRGVTVLLGIVVLLLAGSHFIRYPDIITTQVTISSANPPVKFVARSNGRIRHLLKKNNEPVQKNDVICIIENPANYADVLHLDSIMKQLGDGTISVAIVKKSSFSNQAQLGEMQATYSDLLLYLNQYIFFKENNFIPEKISQLKEQVEYQNQLNKELHHRDSLLKMQLKLGKRKLAIDSLLVSQRAIAPLDYDNSTNDFISKQLTTDANKSSILQNKLQQKEYVKAITELNQQKLLNESDHIEKINEQIKKLRGELAIWEQKYLIKTPEEGRVVFFKIWKENQYVHEGEAVLMVIPPVQQFVARAFLPLGGAGKVSTGQKVLIKLAAYPYQEYGAIRGKVINVSDVPLDTTYAMEIQLAKGLLTTINKQIPTQPQLTGIAEVLTNNRSIFQRIFESLWIRNKQ